MITIPSEKIKMRIPTLEKQENFIINIEENEESDNDAIITFYRDELLASGCTLWPTYNIRPVWFSNIDNFQNAISILSKNNINFYIIKGGK